MTGSNGDWRASGDFLPPGQRSDIDSCDREALHLMPAIQDSGVALVADDADVVIAASTNVLDRLGSDHADVIGATVAELIGISAADLASREEAVSSIYRNQRLEFRAHRSLTGPYIVEGCRVDGTLQNAALLLQRVLKQIRGAHDATTLLAAAADSVREALGFDRVWVYRFDDEANGDIVAESRRADLESFLGLRFDKGDIPPQARRLYLENPVRIIRDTRAASVPIEPSPLPDGVWLDTSGATLRAASPIHLTYLANLGVTASASLAVVVEGRLWGLISGHHYQGPRRLDSGAEQLARLISDVVSMQISALDETDFVRDQARRAIFVNRVLASVGSGEAVLDGLVAEHEALMDVADATGVVLRLANRHRALGAVPPPDAVEALLAHLDAAAASGSRDDVVAIRELRTVVPEFEGLVDVAAGALALHLSRDAGNWIVWFRPEELHEVVWADSSDLHVESKELTPRNSFAKYAKTVSGRSSSWDGAAAAATGLRSALGSLVFQQSERLARQTEALRSANTELDRFAYVAAHDLKEPLRGIHNYADLLQEDFGQVIDGSGETYLAAIRRLAARMNELVESLLTYATVGRSEHALEAVQLSAVVADALDFVRTRVDDRHADIRLLADVELYGARVQFVQVMTNLISNAVKYTAADTTPVVEIDVVTLDDTERGWEGWPQYQQDIPAPLIVSVSDNGIGIPPDRREEVFEVFRRLHGHDEYGGGSGAGLTIARRIAERHGGALWVEANPSGGSRFLFAVAPASADRRERASTPPAGSVP